MSQAEKPFAAARATAVGSRECNQDRCFFFDDGNTLLLGVADGLGGHPRGEVAAQLLADVSESLFRQASRPLADPESFMLDCIARAHAAIRRFGGRQNPPIAPRTTAVLAVIQDGIAQWVHVGDSRLYVYQSGNLATQTVDHAQTQYIRYSADTPPRARTSLTRCLGGMPSPPTTTCSSPFPLDMGDSLLLCTDGFWSQLTEKRLAGLFEAEPERLENHLSALVDEAAGQAISDNVTAIALTWLERAGEPPNLRTSTDSAPRDAKPAYELPNLTDED